MVDFIDYPDLLALLLLYTVQLIQLNIDYHLSL